MRKTDFDRIAEFVQAVCCSPGSPPSQNLLAIIASNADQAMADVATRWIEAGYSLHVASDAEARWIGSRLIWRSPSARYVRKIAVVSSRLGHKLDLQDRLFQALRTVVLRAHPRQDQFVVAAGCAAESHVRRCVELFGRGMVRVFDSPANLSLGEWLRLKLSATDVVAGVHDVSPELPSSPQRAIVAAEVRRVPLRDRTQFAFADQVMALQVRRRGHSASLLSFALADRTFEPGAIRVHIDTCDSQLSEELTANGAVALHLLSNGQNEFPAAPDHAAEPPAQIRAMESINTHEYLGHWTRRRRGPWPGQPDDEYADELILGLASKDRSALSSLARIVAQRKLLASVGSNRTGAPVVSFTAVPLHEWSMHRTFRSHRVRWDFEPYGICIKRDWLDGVGATPVIYGDEDEWKSLPNESRYRFQPKQSMTRSGKTIDWTSEREFRFPGDVDLERVGIDDAFVFVPTIEEARHLARISRWPIVVIHKC